MSRLAYPIKDLHRQVTALEAALLVCRATTAKEPVHALRKATRRIEAQLVLLELIPSLPSFARAANKVRKRLKRIRKEAGALRDLDVQREMVRNDVDDATASYVTTKSFKDSQHRREAKTLRKSLKQRRDDEGKKLDRILHTQEQPIALALLELEETLAPALERTIPAAQLVKAIDTWFHANTGEPDADEVQVKDKARIRKESKRFVEPDGIWEDDLHRVRKVAKLCRYMAEGLPIDLIAAQRLAKRFEALQDVGGQWHDWMLLQQTAEKHGHPALQERYGMHRDAALTRYSNRLARSSSARRS